MNETDHSVYAYLSRKSDQELLGLLGRTKLEEQTEYSLELIDMLTEILTGRGVDTNIDLSVVIPSHKPQICFL